MHKRLTFLIADGKTLLSWIASILRTALPPCPMKNVSGEKPDRKGENFGEIGLTECKKEHNLSAPKLAPNMHTCRPNFLLLP
jgi:hypothetical protein